MDTILEVLIDNSNSMGPFQGDKNANYLLPDGSTRMELAKKILTDEIIPKLDYAKSIRIHKFHSVNEKEGKSTPQLTLIYSGELDKEVIINKINAIEIPTNTGGTPITAAIQYSIDELAKRPNADRKIILVTDGQETDGGDYKKAAQAALNQYGIPCNIFIVGICQDKGAEEKSQALATDTGGKFINLKSKVYDKPSLQAALRPIFMGAVSTSIDNLTTSKDTLTSQPVITKADQSADNVSPVNDSNLKDEYAETLKQNTAAINLISKQLLTITEAIENLKRPSENDEEEIEIIENAQLNEKVRVTSEVFLYSKLKEKFGSRVKWLNEAGESGSVCDFEVTDTLDNSIEYYIECKASMYADKFFLLTRSEWTFFLQNRSKYQLYFIANALSNPSITKIENLNDWIIQEKVIPLAEKNMKLKADRIPFTIFD